jgi:hypothetical protein
MPALFISTSGAPEPLPHGRFEPPDVVDAADVGLQGHDVVRAARAQGRDLLDGTGEPVGAEIGDRHAQPEPREPLGRGEADARSAAGDDRDGTGRESGMGHEQCSLVAVTGVADGPGPRMARPRLSSPRQREHRARPTDVPQLRPLSCAAVERMFRLPGIARRGVVERARAIGRPEPLTLGKGGEAWHKMASWMAARA